MTDFHFFREYKESQKDKTQRHNCWSFISLYLECTQELLDYENLERISDYKLIGKVTLYNNVTSVCIVIGC